MQLGPEHGNVRYSIGNGEAKGLICMTCEHEQRCEDYLREWRLQAGGEQRGKNWDNCNNKINKIQLLKNKKKHKIPEP